MYINVENSIKRTLRSSNNKHKWLLVHLEYILNDIVTKLFDFILG